MLITPPTIQEGPHLSTFTSRPNFLLFFKLLFPHLGFVCSLTLILNISVDAQQTKVMPSTLNRSVFAWRPKNILEL